MLNEKLFIEEPLFELEEANENYVPSVIARSLKKRKIGINLRKKCPKNAKIANFGKKVKLSQAITQDEKLRVFSEFEDMKIWVKTLLEIYGSLPNIIKILDQIISSNAISPFGASQAYLVNTFSQVEKVIDYCERKDKMLNIYVLIGKLVDALDKKDRELVNLKFLSKASIGTISQTLDTDRRNVYRRCDAIVNKLACFALSVGWSCLFISSQVEGESWVKEQFESNKKEALKKAERNIKMAAAREDTCEQEKTL